MRKVTAQKRYTYLAILGQGMPVKRGAVNGRDYG